MKLFIPIFFLIISSCSTSNKSSYIDSSGRLIYTDAQPISNSEKIKIATLISDTENCEKIDETEIGYEIMGPLGYTGAGEDPRQSLKFVNIVKNHALKLSANTVKFKSEKFKVEKNLVEDPHNPELFGIHLYTPEPLRFANVIFFKCYDSF